MLFNGQKHEIPPIFHDTVSEEPIQHCQICGKDVYHSGEPYMIEKAFKLKEVIFEYAICMHCAENMKGEMSKDSMARLSKFMLENARFDERFFELRDHDYDTNLWLSKCVLSDETREEQQEYQIHGIFVGDKMVSNQFPYMIGGNALDEMQELLSPETRGEIDRFKDEFFNIPPELQDLFKDPKFILVG